MHKPDPERQTEKEDLRVIRPLVLGPNLALGTSARESDREILRMASSIGARSY